jgi:UDP-glucuronate decarboxylase
VARIFNTFGPRMKLNDGRVITNFIAQAIRNEPITIYGDGEQTRSFCYVDDLISGLIKLFFTPDIFEPINLGNPEPITIANLAREIIQLTNSKSEIVYKELPSDDPRDREPDIAKARLLLNWQPSVTRKIGLEKTIHDLKSQLNLI